MAATPCAVRAPASLRQLLLKSPSPATPALSAFPRQASSRAFTQAARTSAKSARISCQKPSQNGSLARFSHGLHSSRRICAADNASDPASHPPKPATGGTVALDFEHYPVPADAHGPIASDVSAVVVCHGLLGSKQNWRSLGRAMAKRYGVPVYALDLRNHGTSPHAEGIHYADMAADVLRFMREKELRNVVLIGHSMGGKVSLALTLSPELPAGTISHLVSVDMTPARGPISPDFVNYIDGMREIASAGLKTRSEADKMLANVEPDLGVRQFLLTNLARASHDAQTWTFRIPLDIIRRNISQIGDFPYDPAGAEGNDGARPERKWDGKALFVKGAKSKYVNRRNIPICEAFFPNMKLVTLETGHWVQAEKPMEFVSEVEKFLRAQ